MEWFVAFKYLHIISIIFAIALAVGTELVLRRVAAGGDAAVIQTTAARARPLGNASTFLFIAGIVFGIVAAVTGQMSLLAPWLVASYLAVAGAFAIGLLVVDPWAQRLEGAAAAAADGGSGDDLRLVIDDPAARYGGWALIGLDALLVFLMVVKPLA